MAMSRHLAKAPPMLSLGSVIRLSGLRERAWDSQRGLAGARSRFEPGAPMEPVRCRQWSPGNRRLAGTLARHHQTCFFGHHHQLECLTSFRLSKPRAERLRGFEEPVEVVSGDWR